MSAPAGDSVSFKCELKGNPPPVVTWFFKSKEIADEGRYIIEANNHYTLLDIADIEPSDSGEYVCRIKNENGEDTCSGFLTVIGRPFEFKQLKSIH